MAAVNEICDPTTGWSQESAMRSILLWLLGVPIPLIILIALFSHG
jgi:hypothetical protein